MIVVDTNVISELVKAQPNEDVLSWIESHEDELYLTAITVEEMRFGALCLPEGKRRRALEGAIDELTTVYAHRTFAFDVAAAEQCASFHREAIGKGRTPTIEDLMIAGICASRGAKLATCNIRDFDYLSIPLVNPFATDDATFE